MISIKEVAKQTGVSVRTLRYYDEIDLLQPAGKTGGGHRLYRDMELVRLQEIQFLKTVGFSLREIKQILDHETWDWEEALQKQLRFTQSEKERLEEMEKTLTGLLNGLTIEGEINLGATQQMIQLYQRDRKQKEVYRDAYFGAEDQALLEQLPNMNQRDPDTLEWIALVGQLKQNIDKSPETIEVQQIIRRIHEKSLASFGQNEEFYEKVWEVRKSKEKSAQVGFYPLDEELLTFVERAYEIFEKINKEEDEK